MSANVGDAAEEDTEEESRSSELQASFVSEVDELKRLLQRRHFEADEQAQQHIATIVRARNTHCSSPRHGLHDQAQSSQLVSERNTHFDACAVPLVCSLLA